MREKNNSFIIECQHSNCRLRKPKLTRLILVRPDSSPSPPSFGADDRPREATSTPHKLAQERSLIPDAGASHSLLAGGLAALAGMSSPVRSVAVV